MASQISLLVDGLTDIGNRRKNNEDCWWAGQPGGKYVFMEPDAAPLRLTTRGAPVLLIVSDGVGGANAGEVASRMAVSLISDELSREPGKWAHDETARGVILASLHAANAAITAKAAEPGFEGMGATLSLVGFLSQGSVCWGQAGDSRIYLCRKGKLRQLSRDHSPVGRMRQKGEITEAEARTHPMRNQIDQSLGDTNNPFKPDTDFEEIRPGDVFLVCTDGLSDGLWDREIERVLAQVRAPEDVRPGLQQLIAGAKQSSGRDNITAVVALVEGVAAVAAAPGRPSLWSRLFGRGA